MAEPEVLELPIGMVRTVYDHGGLEVIHVYTEGYTGAVGIRVVFPDAETGEAPSVRLLLDPDRATDLARHLLNAAQSVYQRGHDLGHPERGA